MALALDEPKESDKVFDVDGFQFIVDQAFGEQIQPITIDFSPMGFRIMANIDLSNCSSCGAGGSCCA